MISIKNICYIVAACRDYSDEINFYPGKNDLVIAADGGFDILKKRNIDPDIILGDFDSIEMLPEHQNVIRHPVEKDDTDTFLAYKLGLERGYRNFVIFGGIGGRLDHTIANIQLLLNVAKNAGRAFLVGNGSICSTIIDSKLEFSKYHSGNISVFAQGTTAKNVQIKGLKYTAEGISLTPEFPLGVSNQFVGERAEVSAKEGALLIVWSEKCESFLKNISDFLI